MCIGWIICLTMNLNHEDYDDQDDNLDLLLSCMNIHHVCCMYFHENWISILNWRRLHVLIISKDLWFFFLDFLRMFIYHPIHHHHHHHISSFHLHLHPWICFFNNVNINISWRREKSEHEDSEVLKSLLIIIMIFLWWDENIHIICFISMETMDDDDDDQLNNINMRKVFYRVMKILSIYTNSAKHMKWYSKRD